MKINDVVAKIIISIAEEIKKLATFGSAIVAFFMDGSLSFNKGSTIVVVAIFWIFIQALAHGIMAYGLALTKENEDD